MSGTPLSAFALLLLFALGTFTGLRWAATRRQVDDLSLRLVYTPGHQSPDLKPKNPSESPLGAEKGHP